MEPSVQSKAKIALGKADKAVSWTISAAHRFAKDMIRRVDQEDGAFYIAGESVFTDALLIVALLLAFIIVFLLGYCLGSRFGRRVVTKAVCNGGHPVTAAEDQRVTANGGKQDGNQPAAAGGGEQFTDDGGKQQYADDDVKQRLTDNGGNSTV